jgi:hypothetical protein
LEKTKVKENIEEAEEAAFKMYSSKLKAKAKNEEMKRKQLFAQAE